MSERIEEIQQRVTDYMAHTRNETGWSALDRVLNDVSYLLKELEEVQQRSVKWEKAFDNADKQYLKTEHEAAELRRQLASKTEKLAEAQRQAAVKNEELVTAYAALENLREEFTHLDKGAADDYQKLIQAQQTITKLHEIVEEGRNALNSIIEGEWEETMDDQFLEVWTTRRINPPAIADEALFCMARQLEALGE